MPSPSVSTDPTARFSNRVADYVRYRPGYPPAALACLAQETGLTPHAVVADIGSGTGLLSKLFLDNGNPVFGVEPNREMRQVAELSLSGHPGFTSVEGRAEATTLPDRSIDLVAAGQAFHWFDPEQARLEFQRILKPGGWAALVWNDRQTDTTPFLRAYEEMLLAFASDYAAVTHKNIGVDALWELFGPGLGRQQFANVQSFDLAGVTGRLLSSSYAPLPGHPNYDAMLAALADAFHRYEEDGVVEFLYTTEVFYVQL